MTDQDKTDGENANEKDIEELRESAAQMGVRDADEKDPDEIVDEVRHGKSDSETSPSGWKAEQEGR